MNEQNENSFQQDALTSEFGNQEKQMQLAGIIRNHLAGKKDIRSVALHRLDLSGVQHVLDIGCGFGFFMPALKDRTAPNATITGIDIHPEYEKPFLESCRLNGFSGRFLGIGVSAIHQLPERSYDLTICSYALYFFPDYIDRISKILNNKGAFIAITHTTEHLKELMNVIKEVCRKQDLKMDEKLPYEKLVANFSDENGYDLLQPYFHRVKKYKCSNALIFDKSNFTTLEKFILWKQIFLIPPIQVQKELIIDEVLYQLRKKMETNGQIRLTKDDIIFVCTEPR